MFLIREVFLQLGVLFLFYFQDGIMIQRRSVASLTFCFLIGQFFTSEFLVSGVCSGTISKFKEQKGLERVTLKRCNLPLDTGPEAERITYNIGHDHGSVGSSVCITR